MVTRSRPMKRLRPNLSLPMKPRLRRNLNLRRMAAGG